MNKIDLSIYQNLDLLPIDLQGWNSDSKVFELLIDKTTPKHIIEVGTWKGRSAIHMAEYVQQKTLNCHITCVDTWLGAPEFWTSHAHTSERNLLQKNGYPQIYFQFLSNVIHSNVQDIILPFPNTSRIAYYCFLKNNVKADLIYIDASHEYEDVKDDINNYYTLLNDNGIIFGDDYYNWPGVQQAVQEFGLKQNIKVEVLEGNFWTIHKSIAR